MNDRHFYTLSSLVPLTLACATYSCHAVASNDVKENIDNNVASAQISQSHNKKKTPVVVKQDNATNKPTSEQNEETVLVTAARVKVVVASVDSCCQVFPFRIQPHFVLPTPVSCLS